jgi:hypothetical protein
MDNATSAEVKSYPSVTWKSQVSRPSVTFKLTAMIGPPVVLKHTRLVGSGSISRVNVPPARGIAACAPAVDIRPRPATVWGRVRIMMEEIFQTEAK